MPLGLSRASQYALRALVHLAHQPPGDAATVQAIAAAEDVPQPFLAKVIRRLVAEGIVTSNRGPGGGMRLARDPASIPVLEVVTSVDGADPWSACFLGMPRVRRGEALPHARDLEAHARAAPGRAAHPDHRRPRGPR